MTSSQEPSSSYAAIHRLALKTSQDMGTPLEHIQRDGKLTHSLMHVRQQVIRKIHSTGRYRRQTIADFFGLSICTITASLSDDQKMKPRPFTPDEDSLIVSMHQRGQSIPQIQREISSRSASSIRRRLAHLRKEDPNVSRDHQPSYQGEASSLMLRLARLENQRMRNNM